MTEVEQANWAAPSNVKACTTLVTGGVSQGIYKGLNLGGHVGDCVEHVDKNRELVSEELGFPNQPYWLNQVHGVTVIRAQNMLQSIEGSSCAEGSLPAEGSSCAKGSSITPPDADGAFTFSKGVVCAILTADCMPVFLTTRSGDRGWHYCMLGGEVWQTALLSTVLMLWIVRQIKFLRG